MREAYERVRQMTFKPLRQGAGFDVVQVWPELFVDMPERDRDAVRQAVAASWHEGWKPDRPAVVDLVARARGEITHEELVDRSRRRAQDPGA